MAVARHGDEGKAPPRRGKTAGTAAVPDGYVGQALTTAVRVHAPETRRAGFLLEARRSVAWMANLVAEIEGARPWLASGHPPLQRHQKTWVGGLKLDGVPRAAATYGTASALLGMPKSSLTTAVRHGSQLLPYGAAAGISLVVGRAQAPDAPAQAYRNRQAIHVGQKAGPQVTPAVPFAANVLSSAAGRESEGPVQPTYAFGTIVVGSARTGVHQTARALLLYHPTRHRVAQEAAHPECDDGPFLAALRTAVAGHPKKAVGRVLDPNVGPGRRLVGGVTSAVLARTVAACLEAALVDAVPA